MATYGRLPSEFNDEVAMGLMVNIPAVEASQSLALARGVAIALGDAKTASDAIYEATGDAKQAKRAYVEAMRNKP